MDSPGTGLPEETQVSWLLGHSNGRLWSKLPPSLVLFCGWLQLITWALYCPDKVSCWPAGRDMKSCLLSCWHDLLPCLSHTTAKKSKTVSDRTAPSTVLFFTITIAYSVAVECTWCPHPELFQGCSCGSTSESSQSSTDHGQRYETNRVWMFCLMLWFRPPRPIPTGSNGQSYVQHLKIRSRPACFPAVKKLTAHAVPLAAEAAHIHSEHARGGDDMPR